MKSQLVPNTLLEEAIGGLNAFGQEATGETSKKLKEILGNGIRRDRHNAGMEIIAYSDDEKKFVDVDNCYTPHVHLARKFESVIEARAWLTAHNPCELFSLMISLPED